jgi:hypothetical protein
MVEKCIAEVPRVGSPTRLFQAVIGYTSGAHAAEVHVNGMDGVRSESHRLAAVVHTASDTNFYVRTTGDRLGSRQSAFISWCCQGDVSSRNTQGGIRIRMHYGYEPEMTGSYFALGPHECCLHAWEMQGVGELIHRLDYPHEHDTALTMGDLDTVLYRLENGQIDQDKTKGLGVKFAGWVDFQRRLYERAQKITFTI